jgi:acyl-CoA thioesterase
MKPSDPYGIRYLRRLGLSGIQSGMWRNLHLRVVDAELGVAVIEGTVSSRDHGASSKGRELIHRGALATIADAAMACAGATVMSEGDAATTVDLRVEYFTQAVPGKIRVRAQVRQRSGHILFCDAQVEQAGSVVAEGRATIALVPA